MRAMSFCIAMIDVYSVPWLPDTNATVGPGFAPRMTATAILERRVASGGNGDRAVRSACPARRSPFRLSCGVVLLRRATRASRRSDAAKQRGKASA